MNKSVKKIVSLFVALAFAVSMMAVPTVFAESVAPSGDEHWVIKLYSDAACTEATEISALEPNQEAYAQVTLVGLKNFGSAAIKLNTSDNLTVTEIKWDILDNVNKAFSDAAAAGMETPTFSSSDSIYNKITNNGHTASIFVKAKSGDVYENKDNMTFNVLDGKDVVLGTITVKAADNFAGTGKIELEAEAGMGVDGISIGETFDGEVVYSDLSKGAIDLTNITLPGVDTTKPIDVVQGDPADTENPPAVVKDGNIPPVSETDADKLFGEGSNYYFRVTYTSGTYGYFKITSTEKPGDTSTVTTPTAYIGANSFDLGEENTKDFSITQADFVYPKYSIDTTDTTVSLTVSVQGALYQFKADASITIPRGDTSITLPNADFVALLEKSTDNGTSWTAPFEPNEINGGAEVTITAPAAVTGDAEDVAVTLPAGITLTGKTTLDVKAGPAYQKDNYKVKEGQTFTVYKHETTFNKPIAMQEEWSDGFRDTDTSKIEDAVVDYSEIEKLLGKVNAPAGADATVKVTINSKDYTGTVKIIVEDAAPIADTYRVAANQSFNLDYNTDFAEDEPVVKFEQKFDNGTTEGLWQEVTLPEGDYTYDVSNTREINKPGTYTETVTLKKADGTALTMEQSEITVVVAEMLYDEYQVSLADGVDAYELTYKTPVSAIDTTKLVVKQAKIANGNTDKTFEPITAEAAKIKFMSGNADLSVDAAYITEDLTSVSVLYDGIAAGSIDVAVNKIVTSYDVAWYNNETTLTVPEDITAAELADLVVVTANYGAVKEVIDADVTIEGLAEVTATGTVKVFVDGVDTGKTLSITKDAAATKLVTVSIPVIGVSASGLGTTIIGEDAVAVAGGSNVKVFAEVTGIDAVYTLNIPGFSPVDVTVAEDGTVTIPEDDALYAGWVAVETGATVKTTIDDTDFYAIAANLGERVDTTTGKYDLNKDGKIDALDIDVMLSNLGATIIAE